VRQPRKAYSLLELVLVLAVIVVLGAFAVPGLIGDNEYVKETASTDAVKAAWTAARAQAMKEGRPYRFAVVWNKGNFRVAPDSDDYWKGNAHKTDDKNPALIIEKSLPEGVAFSKGSSSGSSAPTDTVLATDGISPNQWDTVVVFNPDGSASDDVRLEFTGGGCPGLEVRAFTGTAAQ